MRVETTEKTIRAYDVQSATQAEVDELIIEANVTKKALFLVFDEHVDFRTPNPGSDIEMSAEKFQRLLESYKLRTPRAITHETVMLPLGAKPRRLFRP